MKYLILITSFLFLTGFTPSKERPPIEKTIQQVMTETEKEYYKTLTLEQRVFMEPCISRFAKDFGGNGYMETFSDCVVSMKNKIGQCQQIQNNNSMGSAALGAVVGYGAAKLLSNRKRK